MKLDNLAIFSPAITSRPADDAESFELGLYNKKTQSGGNISAVRIQCRNTGLSANENVTRAAEGNLGLTSLAKRIKKGELTLSDTKGEYVVGGGADDGWGDEPLNP